MQISFAALTTAGPVRPNNEDCIADWQPKTEADWRKHGAIAILADGVGGQARGEVASKLACDTALKLFLDSKPLAPPAQTLYQMFTAANLAVYDENIKNNGEGRMATTMTVSVFRHNEVNIGHVGDCRVYVVQQGRIRRVTNDHSYAGVQLKLGLITVEEAASSQMRSVLTRSLGQEPTLRVDFHTLSVHGGDIIVQMCDGLWSQITEGEILNIVSKNSPEDACKQLVRSAERRGADDNLSVQIIQVQAIERLSYYRGLPTFQKESPAIMGSELEVGQVLDGRFRIIDIISRSGMASIFKAIDQKTDSVVALKVPFMQFESDPGFFQRFQREQAIGKALQHPYILRMFEDESLNKSRPYIVMEFLEGQTLGHLMHTIRPMPEADSLKIASRICEALHYMHEHDVVHRDLKPDNIMICSDGSIRIMDFGIAKF
jgi:serine/threonine protein phosphatase PrpC